MRIQWPAEVVAKGGYAVTYACTKLKTALCISNTDIQNGWSRRDLDGFPSTRETMRELIWTCPGCTNSYREKK